MADVIPRSVNWVRQEELYFCGPAVAQMLLDSLGVASPGTPPTWQTQLYDYITQNTNAKRPRTAPDIPSAPAFPEQKCERCSRNDPYTCWSTTPNVLKNLLNANQGVAVYSVSPRANEESATDAVCDTLDKGVPALALVYGWVHWVVVDGYRHSMPGSINTYGRNLNGVYIRDPDSGASSIHYIPWIDWRDDYLSGVPCGQYQNKIVVIRVS